VITQVVASERVVAQTNDVVMHDWGCRTATFGYNTNWNKMEILIIEGDNPVQVSVLIDSSILSSAGHEKSCVNLAGPSAKAKYSPETDSEPVL
jgi:hypothetical protein